MGKDNVIENIKKRKYYTTEHELEDISGAKILECIPVSAPRTKERKTVLTLDDLNVRLFLLCSLFNNLVNEESARSI